jgi:hypothetical protein
MDQPIAAQPSDGAPVVSATPAPAALDPGSIPEIDHYELDGVPLYHIPSPGATILTLAFRVGRADEPVIRGGMTHLAEHLILTSISDALDHSNGATEPFRVTFVVRGSPERASRFLRDVCAAIERPRFGRMHEEAKVLRTEAAGRGGMGMSFRLMWMRTGYQGIGSVSLPEFFLDALDEGVLREWMNRHLVAGNAAIWIAGELPDDLTVSLPPGPRTEPPEVRWIDGFVTPTLVVDEAPGVGASFYVERNVATAAAIRALSRQLTRRIRVDRGLGYEVGSEYLPVSRDHALVSVWTTCLPEATREVQQIMLESIDDIAARGPSDEELSGQYQQFAQDMADPMAIPGRLHAQVRDLLLGGHPSPKPVAALLEEQWRLESPHVALAFDRARDSMLLLLPESGKDPQRQFQPYPGPPMGPMGGHRTFELNTKERRGLLRKTRAPRLAIGAGGVAIDGSDGSRIMAVRWADSVGIIRERNVRSILGRDGTVLQVYEAEWRDGRAAVGLIDKFGPADLVIPVSS